MNGSQYIAEFLARSGCREVFALTGGACAFMLDAIAKHPKLKLYFFQHEQAAAMAADAVWRTSRRVGVTISTSGPGATNLLTGIACSYFDSIPTLHITGQVNKDEDVTRGAQVRQGGFQETDICGMARPITKSAVLVESPASLKNHLPCSFNVATTSRMGPVLIDVPMNVQKAEVGEYVPCVFSAISEPPRGAAERISYHLLNSQRRPLVLVGAGVGLASKEKEIESWLIHNRLPYVASWGGMPYLNSRSDLYCGTIGVYGNRQANCILSSCDTLLVLGSRLDTRQRSGDPSVFAPQAKILAMDVDSQELNKYDERYERIRLDFRHLPSVLNEVRVPTIDPAWLDYVLHTRADEPKQVTSPHLIDPYEVVRLVNRFIDDDAIVVADCGANLCWVYQAFRRTNHTLFTAGGHSPMGYSLPAAIGAAIACPDMEVICFIGDGGFQINVQDLATIVEYDLRIKIIVLNNLGYGIIRQFQDAYLGRSHVGSTFEKKPDIARIASAYGIPSWNVTDLSEFRKDFYRLSGSTLFNVFVDPLATIQPKLEVGHAMHDQYPYLDNPDSRLWRRPMCGDLV